MRTLLLDNEPFIPSKIICIGRNYVEHIEELGNEVPENMVVFLKPNSAISNELSAFHEEPLHFEGEICFRYAQGQFDAVAFGLDLTKRSLQSTLKSKGLPWERAKGFDGAAVFSSFAPIVEDVDSLSVELFINSKLQQHGSVSQMMYKPAAILAELQAFMSLEDGDVVMTGTPKGVGIVQSNNEFHGKILADESIIVEEKWRAK